MKKLRFIFSFLVLIVAASLATSCGAGSSQGKLQSVSLIPPAADADEAVRDRSNWYVHCLRVRPHQLYCDHCLRRRMHRRRLRPTDLSVTGLR